jgi:hypothetical protein
VRYADDFVVLSRYPGKRLYGWIESKLKGWLKLEMNRDKTRMIDPSGGSTRGRRVAIQSVAPHPTLLAIRGHMQFVPRRGRKSHELDSEIGHGCTGRSQAVSEEWPG